MVPFDKSLEELALYSGRNPKPNNLDEFWRASLDELSLVSPEVQLTPNRSLNCKSAECFDLWFKGIGGSRIYAKYLRPKIHYVAPKFPTLFHFHGYSGNSGDWASKLHLVAEGFSVVAMDCRGQGGRSEDRGVVGGNTLRGHIIRGIDEPDPRKLLFHQIYLDTVQLVRAVSQLPETDTDRLGAFGGSQGGALALACAALEPRIRKVVSVFPFLCDFQRAYEMDLPANGAYEEIRQYFRAFDPNHKREKEIFTKLGYIDCQNLAPLIRAETLMLVGLIDTICPPSTQFAAFNKINAKKEMIVYPDFGHEALPSEADHIFNFMKGL